MGTALRGMLMVTFPIMPHRLGLKTAAGDRYEILIWNSSRFIRYQLGRRYHVFAKHRGQLTCGLWRFLGRRSPLLGCAALSWDHLAWATGCFGETKVGNH